MLYSVAAYFIMALGIIAWKFIVADYGIPQILALEALVCLPMFLILAHMRGGLHVLGTAYPLLQLIRGLLQTMAAYIGLYGLVHLPVSTYTMLGYCTPFILAILAWGFLRERCPPAGWACIAVGLVGTALVIQPEYADNLGAALAVIVASVCFAANAILMKQMPKDNVISFPFYTLVIAGAISCVVTLIIGIVPMTTIDLALAIAAGFFFFAGAQFLFTSYRLAPLHVLAPFQYTQILWVVLLGAWLWHDMPTAVQIAGLGLIMASATYVAWIQKTG
jgi:drug/metabolite transporter (DMT)-like permease